MASFYAFHLPDSPNPLFHEKNRFHSNVSQYRGKRYMHTSTIGTDHVVELFCFHDLLLVTHMMEKCALKYSLIEYALN
jgi:hypothetical protein